MMMMMIMLLIVILMLLMIIDIVSLRVIVESDINNRLHRSIYGINIENNDKN